MKIMLITSCLLSIIAAHVVAVGMGGVGRLRKIGPGDMKTQKTLSFSGSGLRLAPPAPVETTAGNSGDDAAEV